MKMRNGFVSNSSSASFIVHWRMKTFGEEVTTEKAVGEVFGMVFKEGIDEIDWEKTWNKEAKEKVEEVIKNTEMNVDKTFTTSFWTSMKNDMDDFGDAAKSLVINLIGNNDFQIVDAKVEDDH